MYKHIIKPILFAFNPETAHNLTFAGIRFLRYVPFAGAIIRSLYKRDVPALEKEVFGSMEKTVLSPDSKGREGFGKFMERYKAGLKAQQF